MIELTRLKAVPSTALHLAELPIEFSEMRGRLGLAPMGLNLGAELNVATPWEVKLTTPRFTPLLYIRQEIWSISRF
jgi:hypothetical protein